MKQRDLAILLIAVCLAVAFMVTVGGCSTLRASDATSAERLSRYAIFRLMADKKDPALVAERIIAVGDELLYQVNNRDIIRVDELSKWIHQRAQYDKLNEHDRIMVRRLVAILSALPVGDEEFSGLISESDRINIERFILYMQDSARLAAYVYGST